MGRDGNSHSEDVVRLKGSRLVISTEINANRSLNESVIKQITSGDTMTARDLHSSSIEFKPTFKLWIAGNHKPKIQNFDHGIKRRLFIIPFEYLFTDEEIRPQYEVLEDFKAERSGILNWALEGARRWYKNKSLSVPTAVLMMTKQYFLDNNIIEQFLLDRCDTGNSEDLIGAKELYDYFVEYLNTVNAQEERLGRNTFYNRLEELGYKRLNVSTNAAQFIGIKLSESLVSNNGNGKLSTKKMQV
jgi:putative DNA primase/helicase